MKHILDDGRELIASYEDIDVFFKRNRIVGREIRTIISPDPDYMIRNLEDITDLISLQTECAIETDHPVCICFSDGDSIEMEMPGDGPFVLGFNTADFKKYREADGNCYTLNTMFAKARGRRIESIAFERTDDHMTFPEYCGIDMSGDDEGIESIRLCLDDGTYLMIDSWLDFMYFSHMKTQDEYIKVPYKDLLRELNNKTLDMIIEEHNKYYPEADWSDYKERIRSD